MSKVAARNDKAVVLLFALPGLLYFLIFKYVPMVGNIIAFKEFNIFQGLWGSPWVGLDQFARMFTHEDFYRITWNTIRLSFVSILFGFPAPILLALMLNEIRAMAFKRSIQTIVYLPHFLSWVIVGSLFINLLSINGLVNEWAGLLGLPKIDYVTSKSHFIAILVGTGIWKEVGWGTIIYLAALSGVNPNLYEAAVVDGAGRWKQIWYITLPSLLPTMVVLLLLWVGGVMNSNLEQLLIFLNPLVFEVGDVLDTYIYNIGLVGGQYSYTTAIGLFKAVIGITLLVALNAFSRKATGESLY
ncbi:ABC transporter permease [Cohnella herbarum]|uniref:Sugar ABC transporter permease n=1 Tax=Cohnella herbarum TaxID=2728023 RepID=A0A7Z2VGD5_9BACL|nr:ABC transporter permease subunit [Cohnella herbarum]QJD82546.1 sugar ABC transporter permease [Cohnella herbarum]